ncbi:MAG: hypothetical protein ACD_19C00140G0001 [uncultured bacterium]|nr:MAG: hypothetical protein ACD_19C00140G0001 [uncultured bacterium]
MNEEILSQKTYSNKAVQKWLMVGKNTITRLAREKLLIPKLVGKRYVFLGEDILKFIRAK